MARLFSSGFELNSITGGVEWSAASAAFSIQSTTVRSGTYAAEIASLVSGVRKTASFIFKSSANAGPFYFRFYFRYATAPTADNTIFKLGNGSPGTIVRIKIASDGSLKLFAGTTESQIGSASSALSTGTWYRVEVLYDNTGGAGAGIIRAYIDGTEFAAGTTVTMSTIERLIIGGNAADSAESQTQGNWFFDDIAINDNTGSFQTSLPGAGSIVHLRPSATGDNGDWTGDNTAIDEVTPDDTTTAISSNTLNQIEDVNIDNTPEAIGSSDTINVVAVGVRYRGAAASSNASFVSRIKASASGTVQESAAITPAGNIYTTNQNSNPKIYNLILYDLPGASTTAWTKADLDTTQIGAKTSTGNTNAAEISTLWLLVDYTPNAAPGDLSISVSDSIALSESIDRQLDQTNINKSDSISVSENKGILIQEVDLNSSRDGSETNWTRGVKIYP